MATNKPVIKVYVDPDINEWLATKAVSVGGRSALINKILRAEKEREASNQPSVSQIDQCSDEPTIISLTASLKEAKRFIDSFEIDTIEYDKHFEEIDEWKAQASEQLTELVEWQQSFPDQELFENLETEEVIAALELLKEIGKEGIVNAVERVPDLEKRLSAIEDQIGQLLSASS
jgi:electron transfer flavoprotein alpha/beta subunit